MALLDWLACAWARKIVPFMVWTALSTVILFSFNFSITFFENGVAPTIAMAKITA